jgi:hypothetical protein
MLIWNLDKKVMGYGFELSDSGQRQVTGSSEHDNKPSGIS